MRKRLAAVAQSVERVIGNDEVGSSNLPSSSRKILETAMFRLIGTQCVIGVQSVWVKASRKLICSSLWLAFYIRIEFANNYIDCLDFQAKTIKILYFLGLYPA